MKKRILVIFGTRPEAIKMGALVNALKQEDIFDTKVCVTAQHREMLDQVLAFFEIVPDYDLNIMKANQTLNELSSRIFIKMDKILTDFKPDLVLVHGDTTTSTIAAWSAFNHKIKIGHIEAGLRTYNKFSPFPEEINRQITGRLSDFHFAPTLSAKQNLISEKITEKNILVTGNTVLDSLFWTINKIKNYETEDISKLKNKINFNKKIITVTGHRRENFGDGFINICKAIAKIAERNDVEIIYPVHLNPNVQKPVKQILSGKKNIHLIPPLDYPSFVWLMNNSYLILTDSGGIQEEAPALGKPVLVMRDTTERPEAVKAGTAILVGTDYHEIVSKTNEILDNKTIYKKMSTAINPYGDGKAVPRIINFIKKNL